jgi:hypothetical protein
MILKALRRWWQCLQKRPDIKRVIIVESMTDVPARLASNFYVVRRAGFDRRAVFNCPCNCGRRIDLNLVKSQGPNWSLAIKNGKATLNPSVWLRDEPCQSHFFIRDNKVMWV